MDLLFITRREGQKKEEKTWCQNRAVQTSTAADEWCPAAPLPPALLAARKVFVRIKWAPMSDGRTRIGIRCENNYECSDFSTIMSLSFVLRVYVTRAQVKDAQTLVCSFQCRPGGAHLEGSSQELLSLAMDRFVQYLELGIIFRKMRTTSEIYRILSSFWGNSFFLYIALVVLLFPFLGSFEGIKYLTWSSQSKVSKNKSN